MCVENKFPAHETLQKPVMNILVVDDDALSLKAQTRALEKWGFEVIAVPNGTAALQIFRQDNAPSMAILDVMMPDPNGIEVCRAIRSFPSVIPPYLIMLTVRTEQKDILEGFEAGANDYIKKPFDVGELQARVNVGKKMQELQRTLADRVADLEKALANVRRLEGLLPICSSCKNIRDDQGYWRQVEEYISQHSNATFTHGICPKCAKRLYPSFVKEQ